MVKKGWVVLGGIAGAGIVGYIAYTQGYLDSILPYEWRINKGQKEDEGLISSATVSKIELEYGVLWWKQKVEFYPDTGANMSITKGGAYKLLVTFRNNQTYGGNFLLGFSYYILGVMQSDGYWMIDVPNHTDFFPAVYLVAGEERTVELPFTVPNYAIASGYNPPTNVYSFAVTIRNLNKETLWEKEFVNTFYIPY